MELKKASELYEESCFNKNTAYNKQKKCFSHFLKHLCSKKLKTGAKVPDCTDIYYAKITLLTQLCPFRQKTSPSNEHRPPPPRAEGRLKCLCPLKRLPG